MRTRKRRVYHYFDPLKDWDGEAYWHDGVTPMRLVKYEMQVDMNIFDHLSKEIRDMLNEHGGISEEWQEVF